MFLFIQEHWLPYHDASYKFDKDFDGYKFLVTSSDMFTHVEDKMLESGPTWHGTALGWDENIDKYVSKIPVISERFCGLTYSDNHTNIIAYTVYMPTSGQDDEFLEVLSKLSFDIYNNVAENSSIMIGLDSNQSDKSSRRRTDAMKQFQAQFSFKTVLLNDSPTFHHNNLTSVSQIDHILYFIPDKSKVKVTLHKHLCKLDNFANLSSHDAIVGQIELPSVQESNSEPDYSPTYTPFVVSKPKWDEAANPGKTKC